MKELIQALINQGIITATDIQRMTTLELLLTIIERVNELHDLTKSGLEAVQRLLDKGVQEEVVDLLDEWKKDGTIAKIINEEVFGELNAKIYSMRDIKEYEHLKNDDDWSEAFITANEECATINVSEGEYLIKKQLILDAMIVGVGYDRTKLIFTNVSGSAIINTKNNNYKGLKRLTIRNKSWEIDETCHSYGLEFDRTVLVEEVKVVGFKKSNIFLHHDKESAGPYYSNFINCYSEYSGEHGVIIGTGANSIQLINIVCRWNGATEFLKHPKVLGNYDGIIVGESGDCNPDNNFPSYTPDGVRIVGGDCSYNSRYGYNIKSCMNSHISSDYSELNLNPNQIAVSGDTRTSFFNFAMGKTDDINVNKAMGMIYPNIIYVGGKLLGNGVKSENTFENMMLSNLVSYLSSGTNAMIKTKPDTNGNLSLVGEGYQPMLTLDNIYQLILNDCVLKLNELLDLNKIAFKGGTNATITLATDSKGNISVEGVGHQPTVSFQNRVVVNELILGDGNEVGDVSGQSATKKIKVIINDVPYYLLATTE